MITVFESVLFFPFLLSRTGPRLKEFVLKLIFGLIAVVCVGLFFLVVGWMTRTNWMIVVGIGSAFLGAVGLILAISRELDKPGRSLPPFTVGILALLLLGLTGCGDSTTKKTTILADSVASGAEMPDAMYFAPGPDQRIVILDDGTGGGQERYSPCDWGYPSCSRQFDDRQEYLLVSLDAMRDDPQIEVVRVSTIYYFANLHAIEVWYRPRRPASPDSL